MKKVITLLTILSLSFLFSCEKEESNVNPINEATPELIAKLNNLGFNTHDFQVVVYEGNIIVENDIVLTMDQLDKMSAVKAMPDQEHYATDYLVASLPRTINVYVSTSFSQNYFDATDAAISRYNAESLTLTFQRVTSSSSADISIVPSPWYYGFFGILGSAGFPTAAGDPHNEIMLTRSYYDGVTDLGALTTTIAHEMGHCIGFRHTDYMDRSFSCGGSTDDEGASDVGANHIAGTPTTPETGSWMLACSDGSDRPFTASDKTALDVLY
ncbi:M57 family metalloprotease [Limibacter armeniacum]|uniref:M57 family metalloprotease n=1 Tax=Limibacter armeniacum TaxID=466084 RepID=UPI002FE5E486